MVTRRSLLKQGAYAALALRAAPSLVRTASAQTTSPPITFDYYISPSGSDSNPGTQSQPWAITAINTHRAEYAGKRVGLLDGTYNVHALCQNGKWSEPALAINGGPNAESPTVIAAVNPRQAILTGAHPVTGAYPTTQSGIIGQGYMQTQYKGNVIIDGLYITRSFQYGIAFYAPVPNQKEGGTSGFIVRNCEVYDIDGITNDNVGGILMYFCTGALISNNKIHSVQPLTPGNPLPSNVAGIFSFNCHSNIYEYNTIYDCNDGIYDKNAYNGNHTHRYNYIECAGLHPYAALKDCSGGDAGDTLTSHNNILIGPVVWDGSTGVNMPSLQSLVFYNNTCIYGSPGRTTDNGIFYAARGSTLSPPATITFYNNIIHCNGTAGYAGLVLLCAGTIELSDYNCFSCAGSDKILALNPESKPRGSNPQLYTLAGWRSATGMDSRSMASAATFASPLDRTPAGMQLRNASPGQGSGRVGGVASGTVTDMGAWGGGATQIGCNFGPIPRATSLSVS
jgi:Right handed beta helix region